MHRSLLLLHFLLEPGVDCVHVQTQIQFIVHGTAVNVLHQTQANDQRGALNAVEVEQRPRLNQEHEMLRQFLELIHRRDGVRIRFDVFLRKLAHVSGIVLYLLELRRLPREVHDAVLAVELDDVVNALTPKLPQHDFNLPSLQSNRALLRALYLRHGVAGGNLLLVDGLGNRRDAGRAVHLLGREPEQLQQRRGDLRCRPELGLVRNVLVVPGFRARHPPIERRPEGIREGVLWPHENGIDNLLRHVENARQDVVNDVLQRHPGLQLRNSRVLPRNHIQPKVGERKLSVPIGAWPVMEDYAARCHNQAQARVERLAGLHRIAPRRPDVSHDYHAAGIVDLPILDPEFPIERRRVNALRRAHRCPDDLPHLGGERLKVPRWHGGGTTRSTGRLRVLLVGLDERAANRVFLLDVSERADFLKDDGLRVAEEKAGLQRKNIVHPVGDDFKVPHAVRAVGIPLQFPVGRGKDSIGHDHRKALVGIGFKPPGAHAVVEHVAALDVILLVADNRLHAGDRANVGEVGNEFPKKADHSIVDGV